MVDSQRKCPKPYESILVRREDTNKSRVGRRQNDNVGVGVVNPFTTQCVFVNSYSQLVNSSHNLWSGPSMKRGMVRNQVGLRSEPDCERKERRFTLFNRQNAVKG